ncbi:MAG: TM0996/MTH895 family glutaredoxin-like protein [Caldilineaceae bacterium]|nr:TM0996/MTH895 family glutaredoxin-like protein [Caldilineaceae bacterium]
MIIKVLGTGCANCKKTKAVIAQVIDELGVDAQLVEVTDIPSIMSYGVMSTPGVVVDEQVVSQGRVPTKQQVEQLFSQSPA